MVGEPPGPVKARVRGKGTTGAMKKSRAKAGKIPCCADSSIDLRGLAAYAVTVGAVSHHGEKGKP
jgi:hypothetical protein